MKRLAGLFLTVVMLITIMIFAAIPVAADVIEAYPYPGNYGPEYGYYFIRNVGSQSYLGAEKTDDGLRYHLQQNGDLFQIKKIQITDGEGKENVYAYQIMVVDSPVATTGHSLRVTGIDGWPENGREITEEADYKLWHQRWVFDNAGNGNVYIRTYLDNDPTPEKGADGIHPYLDIKPNTSDNRVGLYSYDSGRTSQLWKLERVCIAEGHGLANDPFLISTADQLSELSKILADGHSNSGVYYKLTQDINYSGAPIGSEGHPFSGILDGDGHTITLNIITEKTYAGLFVETNGATVKNLKIAGFVSGKNCVGAVAGHAYGNTRIDNCHVTASVTGTKENVGGVVGMMYDSTISNCCVDANVTGADKSTGGIVGWLHNNSNVINCVKTGETIGYDRTGGIAGYISEGNPAIINCLSLGKIDDPGSVRGHYFGGIAGYVDSDPATVTLVCCFSNCNVGGTHAHGYIFGKNKKSVSHGNGFTAKQVYCVENGDPNEFSNWGEGDRIPVTSITSSVFNQTRDTINGYIDENYKEFNGIALTHWSAENGNLFPESCKGFNIFIYQQGGTPVTASVLSQGNLWIIIAVVVLVLGGIATLVIIKRKKNTAGSIKG